MVTQRTRNSSVTIIVMIIILPMSAWGVNLIRPFGVIVISPPFHHPSNSIPLLDCSERYFPLCLHFLLQCAEFLHCILFWSLKTVNMLSNNCEQKDKTSSFTDTISLRRFESHLFQTFGFFTGGGWCWSNNNTRSSPCTQRRHSRNTPRASEMRRAQGLPTSHGAAGEWQDQA